MKHVFTKFALNKLHARRKTILENKIGDGAEIAISDHPADFLSQASLGNIQDTLLMLRGKQLQRLKEIDSAIARVNGGTYGICANCGELIHQKRLEAFPETLLCIACKEDSENLKF